MKRTQFFRLATLALILGMVVGPYMMPVRAQSNQIVSTAAGTITTSKPFIGAQTWNAGGVSFMGLQLNITETASAAGSHYLDINGGAGGVTSEFFVAQGGSWQSAGAGVAIGSLTSSDATTPQFILAAGKTNTGKLTVNGKTSGSLIVTAADATAQAVTLTTAAQTVGAGSVTIQDLTGGARNLYVTANTPASLQTAPQTVYASAGYTNATNSFTNVTGLSFAVAANTSYHVTCYMTWNPGGATTVGPKYIWTGPASPTAVTAAGQLAKTVTTSSFLSVAAASFATTLDDAVAVTASITQTDVLTLGLVNGANAGTVQLQAALHSASGTYTLSQGSYCTIQ